MDQVGKNEMLKYEIHPLDLLKMVGTNKKKSPIGEEMKNPRKKSPKKQIQDPYD